MRAETEIIDLIQEINIEQVDNEDEDEDGYNSDASIDLSWYFPVSRLNPLGAKILI